MAQQDTKWTVHDNIWHFSVTDPQLHKKGFTVYKVTCKTFPIKSPETLTEVVCWKRYNDFKTLYKALLALHKALHRRDQFPEFAKPKLFGRFDENVIEERRQSAVQLLNFVATQPHLYKSLVFKQFLEEGRARSDPSKKGAIMTPRPSNLDILASSPKTDGNPQPDIVPTRVGSNMHRQLKQEEGNTSPSSDHDHESQEKGGVMVTAAGDGAAGNGCSDLAMLEGTWNYPQLADNISLDSSTGDETVDTDDDSILATSLPDTDLAFFDPLGHDSGVGNAEDSPGGIKRSSSWLQAGLSMCAEMESQGVEDDHQVGDEVDSATTPMAPEPSDKDTAPSTFSTRTSTSTTSSSTLEKLPSDLSSSTNSNSRKGSTGSSAATLSRSVDLEEFDPIRKLSQSSDTSKVECGKGDLDLSAEWQMRSSTFASSDIPISSQGSTHLGPKLPPENIQASTVTKPTSGTSSRSHSVGSDRSQDSDKGASNKSTPSRTSRSLLKRLVTGSPGSRKPRSATESSVSTLDLGGKEDYIYLAASQICMAQNSEANGDFEVAFAYYKSGVGILLQGVQGDTNKTRRDAVRRKTAQYLMKAEDLFNRHLATENVDERRWGADSFLSPSLDLDPSFAFIRGSIRELRSFQVLGTLDSVILVRDKGTDETFVIKTIPKSTPDTERTQTILPTSCPHMVSLHKFYETDDSVFLLLQYASGGKLWTYIGDYLNCDRRNQANGGVDLDVVRTRNDSGNIYTGTKVEIVSRAERTATLTSNVSKRAEGGSSHISGADKVESKKREDDAKKGNNVQCSEEAGIMRFSTLKKEISESSAIDQLTEQSSQNREEESIGGRGETRNVGDFEHQDLFNESSVSDDFVPTQSKEPLNRRISSLSDDYAPVNEGDSSVISPTTLPEEDPFQSLLHGHRSNLEDFSINSFDSEDTHHHSSSFREKIESIPEDSECGINSPKHLAARQVSADEVFTLTRKEAFTNEDRVRHASTDGVFPQRDASEFASTFNSDEMIRNSRELLRHVERVLSETNDRSGEDANTKSSSTEEESSAGPAVIKENSTTSNESSEEPSIYDVNRSSEEDTSDRTSVTNSDKNLDSPVSDKAALNPSHLHEEDMSDGIRTSEICAASVDDSGLSQLGENLTSVLNTDMETDSSKLPHQAHTSNSLFKPTTAPHKLSINRMDSKDMTRSASFECDLKSPTRNRARAVSDLFERLDSTSVEQVRIPESSIRKWMAQLVTAVSRLHSLGIICRDLKPSNVLLGDGGQVFLTYFCHLGHGEQTLDWEAIENLYAAPEVGSISGYDKSCDWWSIGALLYELVVGRSLSECHPGGINSHTCLHIPAFVSNEARGLLEGLLRHNPNERLGSGMAGSEEIKAHPFFTGVDWHSLEYS